MAVNAAIYGEHRWMNVPDALDDKLRDFGLSLLVRDETEAANSGHGTGGAHVVEQNVLLGGVELLATKHAVVEASCRAWRQADMDSHPGEGTGAAYWQ